MTDREGKAGSGEQDPKADTGAEKQPPSVFIVYAWDEDEEHKTWVRTFADRLRNDGIDAKVDVHDGPRPGDELAHGIERLIVECDFILAICTPTYRTRFDNREGVVGFEARLITAICSQTSKCVPLLRSGDEKSALPIFLRGKVHLDFRGEQISQKAYHGLLDTLLDRRPKPGPLGTPPPRLAESTRGAFRLEPLDEEETGNSDDASSSIDDPKKPAELPALVRLRRSEDRTDVLGTRLGGGLILTTQDELLPNAFLESRGTHVKMAVDGVERKLELLWAGGSRVNALLMAEPDATEGALSTPTPVVLQPSQPIWLGAFEGDKSIWIEARCVQVGKRADGTPTYGVQTDGKPPAGAPVRHTDGWLGILGSKDNDIWSVVWLSTMQEDLRWCQTVGANVPPEALQRYDSAKAEIRRILEDRTDLADILVRKVFDGVRLGANELAEALISASAEAVAEGLYYVAIATRSSMDLRKSAGRLLAVVLPWCIETRDPTTPACVPGRAHRWVATRKLAVVEAVMAGEDGRLALYRRGSGRNHIGKSAVVMNMEHGIDKDGTQLARAAGRAAKRQVMTAADIEQRLRRAPPGAPVDLGMDEDEDLDEVAEIIKKRFEMFDDEEDRARVLPPLYVVVSSKHASEASVMEAQTRFEHLRLVYMDENWKTTKRDRHVNDGIDAYIDIFEEWHSK